MAQGAGRGAKTRNSVVKKANYENESSKNIRKEGSSS